jgi:two-component system, OmpR family, copper resistance phosphate regulon response regulator CusR
MPPRVLLIEDEPGIALPVQQALRAEGLEVVHAASAASGMALLQAGGVALLVLDLNLPDRSGWDVLDAARRHQPGVLVLMATARDGLSDRLRGLREGADDYLPKPFALAELVARVQALLRRSRSLPQAQLALADLQVDLLLRKVQRGAQTLELTAREFDLLHLLLRAAGRTVSRDTIGREVWQQAARATPLDNLIDVHVAHLRRKLEAGGAPRLLHTVRGMGFQLSEREP